MVCTRYYRPPLADPKHMLEKSRHIQIADEDMVF